jgi:hypothetical protein
MAQSPPEDELMLEQISVRELMRLDTALAISQSKNKLDGQGKPAALQESHRLLTQHEDLKLIAIYGVGKKLLAEVSVGAHPYVYMHGRALPVGLKSSAVAYRLRAMTSSCVQLERNDESHTLCLHPSLTAGG